VFENVLGQQASVQLTKDIKAAALAQAMLFHGPPASGKGTAALELGRVLSCEAEASNGADGNNKAIWNCRAIWDCKAIWNCQCSACSRQRLLLHPDLLCLGPRFFSAEISASSKAFLKDTSVLNTAASHDTINSPVRILFIRSVRKLLARFNPVLWEDDSKGAKIFPLVNSLEDSLDELASIAAGHASAAKLVDLILKDSYKLESEGVAEIIPIGQLRRAAAWSHLAPVGRAKLLILENADRMQDEARNSMLKILEEPPASLYCVLTSSRPGSLLPTILSRLRPYRFFARDAASEREVIRRVFREEINSTEQSSAIQSSPEHGSIGSGSVVSASTGSSLISAYLDSFLPVSGSVLEALAALFAASVASKARLLSQKSERLSPQASQRPPLQASPGPLPQVLLLLEKHCGRKAEEAGLGAPITESGELIAKIIDKAGNFEIRSLFSRFLAYILDQVSQSQRNINTEDGTEPSSFLPVPEYNEMWKKSINWAGLAMLTYKLRPAQVLEKLFTDLGRGMADL